MSTSSAASRRFREQMKMPDLTGIPLRPSNTIYDDIGESRIDRIGGTISSVVSESSEGKEFDDGVMKKGNKFEPLSRNLVANRYSSTVRPKQE